MAPHAPKVVLGTSQVGDPSDVLAKFNSVSKARDFLALFRSFGGIIIDTARVYSPGAHGSSESLLGQTDISSWGIVDTKVFSFSPGSHKRENILKSIDESLTALRLPKVQVMYLHAPERTTPHEETCSAMNDAHKAGKFQEFGLSNFAPAEVEEIVAICEKNGWLKPSVYQGQYNAIARRPEEELLSVLRKHGIRFYAYSPGAAGMLSGKVTKESVHKVGSRWDLNHVIGQIAAQWYLQDPLIDAGQRVAAAAEKAGITGHAAALRWVLHHSALDPEKGDGMVIGASSLEQLEENLKITQDGPLPDELVKLINDVWAVAKPIAPPLHY